MILNSPLFSILIVTGITSLLIGTGLLKRPGIGIIGTLLIMGVILWTRDDNLGAIGLSLPLDWSTVIFQSFLYSFIIYFISTILIEPLSEKVTKTAHDYKKFDGIRGNRKATLQLLIVVWIFVAIIEEAIFRGFLMNEIFNIIGKNNIALAFCILFTSIAFGFAHGYQNLSGVLSTSFIGSMLAYVFVLSNFNLWVAIVTHGFIDTIGILLIFSKGDLAIRERFLAPIWKLPTN